MVQIGDVFQEVPLNLLMPSAAAAVVRGSAGAYHLNLSAAATTYIVGVPIYGLVREGTRLPQAGGIGLQVKDLVVCYTPTVANLTTPPTVTFYREAVAEATTRAAGNTPFGAVTYEYPIGTAAASLPIALNASTEVPYVARAIPAAPIYLSGLREFCAAEITFATGAGATCRIHKVALHLALELK